MILRLKSQKKRNKKVSSACIVETQIPIAPTKAGQIEKNSMRGKGPDLIQLHKMSCKKRNWCYTSLTMKRAPSIPNPFTHGKIVSGEQFTNRTKEIERISKALRGRSNLLIAGDRRIGKTSLIQVVLNKLEREGYECFYLNLDPITSIKAFIERYAMLFTKHKTFGKKAGEIVSLLIKALKLETSFSEDGTPTFGLKWETPAFPKHSDIAEVLTIPKKLSEKSKKPWIVVLDEFQNIIQFEGDINLLAEFRSAVLEQRNVNYVFMGSETTILERLFSSADEKFFNSVRKEPIGLISRAEFTKFIINQFKKRNVCVSQETAEKVCDWAKDIPANIQHFSAVIWDSIPDDARLFEEKDFPEFLKREVEYQDEHFLQLWKALSNEADRTILRELAKRGPSLMTAKFCYSVGLDKSTASRRILKFTQGQLGFLLHKRRDGYYFSDPFFEEWVRQKT